MKSNRPSTRRNMQFESMEKRELFTADLGFDLAANPITNGNSPGVAEINFVDVAGGDAAGSTKKHLATISHEPLTSGMPTGKRQHKPLLITKPVAVSEMQWDIVNNVPSQNSGREEQFYTIQLENATVTASFAESDGEWFVADSFSFGVEHEMDSSNVNS